ncbi:MAG: bifunctional 5,10-methylenetetrahydrofolate dehydrogenase/5,10-methenyltetrahydrofolate cyclohydrolase [Candidatus Magasanikbacteria bacterium]|jgi:methylenetetrahydrofolate dehydrogenase (NADP+) / methenyltetrahydrofolate cyclohydrolase|nr:bifunctional 5,10-methylenetetrahydrofolate dehydrogenase/5,10-methenyltetrahydrofolate cyclohydrolase [Candidatus Magasanikbacteria bacterium]MBT5820293.1 bifunctional 5,10-methylenetetrahydrofolate dehydrogenase/5,10-methenyltetrahydrofolate cyclohydrolase [Candidatus Magasanikbacteria bacterium]MBT6294871.1 bifunctional 5,10-methylenetetrahydrofolate dehydrogenase/5,10-methenyltetrahydrofolate cyclohydrolase [Candidatus Magasanikbacteria bacterium]
MPKLFGKPIAESILATTAQEVELCKKEGIAPAMAVILVGEDKPSHTYVRKKKEAAERVGIGCAIYELPEHVTQDELLATLQDIQSNPHLHGLIVQLPLPKHLDTNTVLNAIDPKKDIDCLTNVNLGKLVMKDELIIPPTPGAVMSVLESINIEPAGKNVTIIGVGALVGKPLAIILMNKRASVTTCNSATRDTKEKCLAADIIVTGVGKKDTLRGDMVKKDAIVIDTGVDFEDGKMYGDVHVQEIDEKGARVTPTPGGIGPITVARLLYNTVVCAKSSK